MSKRVNRDDIDKFHDYGIYVPKRTIYLGSVNVDIEGGEAGVDASMAERVIKNLTILDTVKEEAITIIMNNPGGDVNHGLAIYDAIKACRSHVTVKVYGYAMSMGSIILQAADNRVMSPNSSQMIHYGHMAIDKHQKTVYKHTEEAKRIDRWMEQMYLERIQAKHPKFTVQRIKQMLNFDTFLTAEQSVELGLADEVSGDE
jgi:ATP-dependent Clp protease protease subunit